MIRRLEVLLGPRPEIVTNVLGEGTSRMPRMNAGKRDMKGGMT